MHDHNRALLANHAWSLALNEHTPCLDLLKARYLRGESLMHHRTPRNASHFWHGICMVLELVKIGSCYKIGSGASMRIWEEDHWLPGVEDRRPKPIADFDVSPRHVFELINQEIMTWKLNVLMETFEEGIIRKVITIKLHWQPRDDVIQWATNSNN